MKKNRGFSFIEIFLTTAIIVFLMYIVIKISFKGPAVDEQTQKALIDQGINPTDYTGMINAAKNKVNDVNKRFKKVGDEFKEIED